jgi:hypothetical protein
MQSSSVLNPAGFLLDQHHSTNIQLDPARIQQYTEFSRNETFFFLSLRNFNYLE